MRTLVVSDLHLGLGRRHAVLQSPRPRERLLAALAGVERLVLLGDVVELLVRPAAASMAAAAPVLRALGEQLPAEAEVVLVPGNHDRSLIAAWLRRRAAPLHIDTAVPLDATPQLARLAGWLGAGRVRVHYPGVWLGDGVWATHGHYLDRHLFPERTWGIGAGLLAAASGAGGSDTPGSDAARPEDYEGGGRSHLGRARSRLPGVLRGPLGPIVDLARAATMPAAPGRLLSPRLAPLTAPLLSFQMQHAAIPALARVARRLGVQAQAIIFGHVHRLGPLAGDVVAGWEAPGGSARILNCGSWLYEPMLLHNASPPHPYWPGGAVLIEAGSAPRAVGLLDDLSAEDLHRHGRGRRRR